MRGTMKLVASMLIVSILAVSALASVKGTKDEAVALVKKAVAYYHEHGQDRAFAAINDSKGQFVDRDLYVVVYDINGNCLAHGFNPRQIGKNLLELRDPDGVYFVKERVELAKTKSSFWQDYKFMNPQSKLIEEKSMYMEKVGDLLIGCGAYK